MSKKKRWIVAAVLIGCFSLTAVTEAQVQIFKKRASTALTEHDIQLTQGEGPWLIMCASFTGERGMQQALQLANELRNDCLLYTSPSPRDATLSRMPSSA